MNKKTVHFAVLGSVAFLTVMTLSLGLWVNNDIPNTIIAEAQEVTVLTDNNEEPCVPSLQMTENDGHDLILVAEAETTLSNNEPATYRMWYHDNGTFDVITPVELEQFGICGTAYTEAESINNVPITTRIPLSVARELTLKFYQKIAVAQGEDAYREMIESAFTNPPEPVDGHGADNPEWNKLTLTSVEVWVYEQMGINIPEDTYRLENIDDEYRGPGLGGD